MMEGKYLSPVWDSGDPSTSQADSKSSRRALRRNRSDSEILDKDVPPINVQGEGINFRVLKSFLFYLFSANITTCKHP